jgi:hypothetical protein
VWVIPVCRRGENFVRVHGKETWWRIATTLVQSADGARQDISFFANSSEQRADEGKKPSLSPHCPFNRTELLTFYQFPASEVLQVMDLQATPPAGSMEVTGRSI